MPELRIDDKAVTVRPHGALLVARDEDRKIVGVFYDNQRARDALAAAGYNAYFVDEADEGELSDFVFNVKRMAKGLFSWRWPG